MFGSIDHISATNPTEINVPDKKDSGFKYVAAKGFLHLPHVHECSGVSFMLTTKHASKGMLGPDSRVI